VADHGLRALERFEAGLTGVIGAGPHERSDMRTALRNGHRPKAIMTTAGDLELRIPKLRACSFFPSLLERHRRVDQSLFAVVMEAYLHGTSTRKVDDLVKALGADTGISKSDVSRICAELDVEAAAFRGRSLAEQSFRYVFWTPLIASLASITGWSPRLSWWRPVWPLTGAGRCSALMSATARTARSGPRSCAR
jgi:putative transposase